jgi:hypothetical protein
MKKLLLFLFLIVSNCHYAQSTKGSYQAGISVLPIADFLNFFPDNKIKGVAVSANAGTFLFPGFAVGFNPFYATVSNAWQTELSPGVTIAEEDHIQLYGLNAYTRYYLANGQKVSFYIMLAGGFGNQAQQRVSSQQETIHTSVYTIMPGAGMNIHIAEHVAIELNIPYIKVNQAGSKWEEFLFHSVAPTVGFQFTWQ